MTEPWDCDVLGEGENACPESAVYLIEWDEGPREYAAFACIEHTARLRAGQPVPGIDGDAKVVYVRPLATSQKPSQAETEGGRYGS